MKESAGLFQERLEQLDAGEPLETCTAGLPQDEAELLRLAAQLREVQYPARDSDTVAAQRAQVQRLAVEGRAARGRSAKAAEQAAMRPRRNWLRPALLFSGAAALLFLCAFSVMLWAGVNWWSSRDQAAQDATSVPGPTLAANLAATSSSESHPTAEARPTQSPVIESGSQAANNVFLPVVSAPEIRNLQVVSLRGARGVVEIQTDDGNWTALMAGHIIRAGQQIRTGPLSSAQLIFYDGSQVYLGPDTELSVDELDARVSDGPRVVALTQWGGETRHDVVPTGHRGSRYEVQTPSATGEARGTSFHVLVTRDQLTRFSVDEGSVAVTGQGVTVPVMAGQATTIQAGQAPSEPAFRITGEGEVTQIGTTWIIAGQTFLTHEGTVIVGNPQVGDWVFVEGRLLADDTRIADWILLLHRSPTNRFRITGRVEAMGDTEWTIAGQTILVDDETEIDEDIEIEDLVHVDGVILPGGTLLAERIRLLEEEPGLPFDFIGVVQDIADETWTISGVVIVIDDETEIDEGLLVEDIVRVRGWILDDGTWLARSIERVKGGEREFEFTGQVESIDPWVVAGIPFETREWTRIEPGIAVDDWVRVRGRILEDGTWVASEIERLDDDDGALQIVFVGSVDSVDPWVVSGIPLTVDDDTILEGDVGVDDLVRVKVRILPDGTWLAVRITLISDDEEGQGCLQIVAVVVDVGPDWMELSNWPTLYLDDDIPIEGEIQVGSVILLFVCVDDDGTINIVRIVVIYSPESDVTPAPPPPPPPPSPSEDKVTICHKPNSKNPRTITVSRSALQAHLDHGDTIGPCK